MISYDLSAFISMQVEQQKKDELQEQVAETR